MKRKSMRNYQPTKRRLMQFIGSPLEDVVTNNGSKDRLCKHRGCQSPSVLD
ncbi:hypothetical protein PENSOL_c132G11145 [Penicillium solitum]|uniref:Uncharacterized protein n=1 Tax=Penicillium solitum TaxID=60172 RepID=A0A1V6Q5V2_9EURO|nr:uncharacterized protein PENSOL_c132G11145 [Penicillium solitum]OQD84176.1 hypothetical protein PENSOL_c132G11145 [Penicillium solitum]